MWQYHATGFANCIGEWFIRHGLIIRILRVHQHTNENQLTYYIILPNWLMGSLVLSNLLFWEGCRKPTRKLYLHGAKVWLKPQVLKSLQTLAPCKPSSRIWRVFESRYRVLMGFGWVLKSQSNLFLQGAGAVVLLLCGFWGYHQHLPGTWMNETCPRQTHNLATDFCTLMRARHTERTWILRNRLL
jgi:hypothetical protein